MLLEIKDLDAGYGDIQVLWNINMYIDKGEIVAFLGPNGSGKTTLAKTILGLIKPYRGKIVYMNKDITMFEPYDRVRLGISIVPEGRRIFPHLTVLENLYMGMYKLNKINKENIDKVLNLFPRLKERISQKAGTLSGGEQQMLAIARAIISEPRLVIMDEPSQGLAPKVIEDLFNTIKEIKKGYDISIILIEQYIHGALKISDRVYIIKSGKIAFSGETSALSGVDIANLYFR